MGLGELAVGAVKSHRKKELKARKLELEKKVAWLGRSTFPFCIHRSCKAEY